MLCRSQQMSHMKLRSPGGHIFILDGFMISTVVSSFLGCWHNLAEWELSAFQHANALVRYCQWSVIICFETEAIFDVMFCWNEATSQPSKGYSSLDLIFMNQMSVKEWLTHLPKISTPKEKQIHTVWLLPVHLSSNITALWNSPHTENIFLKLKPVFPLSINQLSLWHSLSVSPTRLLLCSQGRKI